MVGAGFLLFLVIILVSVLPISFVTPDTGHGSRSRRILHYSPILLFYKLPPDQLLHK